jgi:hypothetical protein
MANLATPGRWLRHKKDGTIYGHTDILAKSPDVEEVPEEMAFPERFVPNEQKGRKSKLDLSSADTDSEDPEPKTKAALAADASRKLPK